MEDTRRFGFRQFIKCMCSVNMMLFIGVDGGIATAIRSNLAHDKRKECEEW